MIYSVVGTHQETRRRAIEALSSLGEVSQYIYSEQADELESHIDATNLFGDSIIISCVQLSGNSSSKEILITFLPRMKESKNIFIVDEPFADVHLRNTLRPVSVKFFDAKEEKKKDVSVFALCDSFALRDKKQAWIDFMDVRERESGEAIAGALWWKFQQIWSGVRSGKKSAFSLSDCERIGGDLVRASIVSHQGERDLMTELEKIIVSL